jgi:hypothetical protein
MAVRGYPRHGLRLAPKSLIELLDIPMSRHLLARTSGAVTRLADLDEAVWDLFDEETCRELAESVIQAVPSVSTHLPPLVRNRLLPVPPGVRLEDLGLSSFTYNALRRSLATWKMRLSDLTIGRVLDVRNFGTHSLLELLVVLESAPAGVGGRSTLADPLRAVAISGEGYFPEPVHCELITAADRLVHLPEAGAIHGSDPRLRPLLTGVVDPRQSVQEAAMQIHSGATQADDPATLARRLDDLHDHIKQLAELPLEEELTGLAIALSDERNGRLFARRYGWDGRGGATLRVIADEYGVTRARVGQICDRVITRRGQSLRIRAKQAWLPATTRVFETIAQSLPTVAATVEARLYESGLTRRGFVVAALPGFAKQLGWTCPFTVEDLDGGALLLRPGESGILRHVRHAARRAVEQWGAATIEDIAAQVETAVGSAVRQDVVTACLSALEGFRWLDEADGWFWLTTVERNRLTNRIAKVLAVAGAVRVQELRGAIAREYRMEGFAPPRRVLLALCAQLDGYAVDGDTVRATQPLDWEEVLAIGERTLVRILKEHGGVMRREDLEAACLRAGMSQENVAGRLSYSPAIARLATGIYGLPGVEPEPGLIEALAPTKHGGRVVQDYGWDSSGRPWVAYQLSEGILRNGVISIPAAMLRFLSGEWELRTAFGLDVGTLVVGDRGSGWGIRHLLRRHGYELGDVMLLRFDISTRSVSVMVSDVGPFDMAETIAVLLESPPPSG